MDSLSQILLGATTAAVVAPSGYRRRALLIGAGLGTLPDLDVLIDYGDAVANMTEHRGFSHSLFVLSGASLALWAALCTLWPVARQSPWRWLAVFALPLLTHPLLDALTVYGTQLFWPLTSPPMVGGSVFIIDPLYTLPLLVAVLTAVFVATDQTARRALAVGLLLSTSYLGWGLAAQAQVDRIAARSLAGSELAEAPRLIIAAPFNTVLWRILVLTPDGYLEGQRSLWADRGAVTFQAHAFDRALLEEAAAVPAVQRLLWFSHGFQRADVVNDELVLSDLRMGQHPNFFFTHLVARREGEDWVPADNRRLPVKRVQEGQLGALWRRIWRSPDQAADQSTAIRAM